MVRKIVNARFPQTGLSLFEIVIATSLLAGVSLLFSRVFGVALRGAAGAAETAEALVQAEAQLNRLTSMTAQNRWDDLLAEDGLSFPKDGFQIDITVQQTSCYSPCSSAEEPFVSRGEARSLQGTTALAEVRIRRENLNVKLARVLTRPELELADPPIEIRGLPSSSVPADAPVSVTAHLLAKDNSEIPATFQFHVIPGTGLGTILASRDGKRASFRNLTKDDTGAVIHTGGSCKIRATTRYFGRTLSVDSGILELDR